MAIQAPPKPETRLPGEIWKAFVRSKPNDPRIEQAIDYAVKHNHPLFNTTIKTIDAAAKPDGLWDDLLAMLHEEEDHKELHTERGHADNEHENMHDASGEGKALGSILSAFKEPKFMEEDPEFWELVKKEEKAWDEKNPKPGNDATEEEKLAYEQDFVDAKYGSLDDPESTSFQKLAGEKFEEEHSGEKEKQENKTPDPKKVAKWNTYQAYRNTPISFGKDHEIGHVRHSINEEAAARLRVLQKSGLKGTDLDQSYNAVLKRIKQKHWTKFVETHQGEEGKAEAYAKEAYKNKQAQKDFDDFKKAHEAWEKEKALKATKEDQTRQTPPETSPVLSEKEKLEQEFLQFKKEWAQKKETTSIIAPPQKIPAHPLYKTTPGQPSILPQVKPILPPAKNMPSQGIIRPGANASSVPPQQNLRPSQGQTRTPGFRFSLPRLRIPSNRNPVMSPQPRQPGLDRLNSGLTNGVNALQTGLNTFRNAEKLLSGLRGGAFLFNPTAIVIGVILLLIILLLFGFLTAVPSFNTTVTSLSPTPAPATTTNGIPGLTLTLTGPTAIANSDNIQYTINASYTGTAEITLTDTFPPNTQLVNATGIHTKTDTTAVWKLSENEATGTAPKVYIFTFILGPNKEDMLVKNKIVANATGGTGSGIPPTADNCGGLYTLANPLGNFGDPTCDFKKDDLYTLLKQQDPANADKWFFKIVPCESSYNPNTWRDPNILPQTPDPAGAWGLFQMGRGRNGQYDHGDVYWKDQATSAVEWNKLIGGSFGYWACK